MLHKILSGGIHTTKQVIYQLAAFCLLSFRSGVVAQNNTTGLKVIKDVKLYKQVAYNDSAKTMADLKRYIPHLMMDLRYASKNNFTGRRLYPYITTTYMRLPAIRALCTVQKELNAKNLGLKIYDAYRPYAVTKRLWELVKDERYAADPKKGSGHNRGVAVDLTIIDMHTMQELNMGTGFDNFSDTAHHTFTGLQEAVLGNRRLLKHVMEKYGFRALETEWWHYSLPDASEYELLDISFQKLRESVK